MAIRRRRSFGEIMDSHFEDLEREFERWREEMMERPSWNLKACALEPLKETRVTPIEVIMTVDLPMTVESSLEVKPLDESTLEIKAKMKRKMSFKELGITHHKGEFQQFHCHSRIPVPVQMSKMHVNFKKGILEIHIPRKRRK